MKKKMKSTNKSKKPVIDPKAPGMDSPVYNKTAAPKKSTKKVSKKFNPAAFAAAKKKVFGIK